MFMGPRGVHMFQILAALLILGTPATNKLCPVMGDPVDAKRQIVEVILDDKIKINIKQI